MKLATRDIPNGTPILIVTLNGRLFRGTVGGHTFDGALMLKCDELGAEKPRAVYVDEPEEGTWSWACRQLLEGRSPTRTRGDGLSCRLAIEGDDILLWCQSAHSDWHLVDIMREDLTAKNWKV